MWREDAIAHARACFPLEACGLVVEKDGQRRFIPAENIHPNPETNFCVAPAAWVEATKAGRIVACVHSHPGADGGLSTFDRSQQGGLCWVVIGLATKDSPADLREHPAQPAALFGRSYVYGVTDCWSFVRDWFRVERGIELPDVQRDGAFWTDGTDRYAVELPAMGFRQVDAPQPGDLIVMQIRAKAPNHAAVYLGNSQIGHQMLHQLSQRTQYGETYRRWTRSIWRHAAMEGAA